MEKWSKEVYLNITLGEMAKSSISEMAHGEIVNSSIPGDNTQRNG